MCKRKKSVLLLEMISLNLIQKHQMALLLSYYDKSSHEKPFDKATKREILDKIPSLKHDCFKAWCSHAIPDETSLKLIQRFLNGSLCIEVGAGMGFWAHLLGKNVVATDKYIPDFTYVDVHYHDASDPIAVKYDALLIIWPLTTCMSCSALKNFKGKKVVFIGYLGAEHMGCEHFYKILSKEFYIKELLTLPAIHGYENYVYMFERWTPGQI